MTKLHPLTHGLQSVMRSSQSLLILSLITIAGICLRLYHLDSQSFWLDEGFSANIARHPSLQAWSQDSPPPLYYALLAAWSRFSDSDYWLRLLSVIFGVATIPVVYSLGRKLFGPRAGLWQAAALPVLSFHVRYSQEARMYSLLAFLFACALWGLVSAARDNSLKHWLAYTISSTLIAYSLGAGVIYVAVLAMLFPLCARNINKAANWVPWLFSNAAVALLFLPWLGIYMQRAHDVARDFWVPAPSWSAPLLVLRDFTVAWIPAPSEMSLQHLGAPFPVGLPDWLWVVPIVLVLVYAIAKSGPEKVWVVRTLVAAYVLPILVIFLLSLAVKPIFLPRVFLPTVIPMVLLLGAVSEVSVKPAAWLRAVIVVSVLLLVASTFYYFRYTQKEHWREASQFLQQHVAPGDVILYNDDGSTGKYLINRYDAKAALRSVEQVDINTAIELCIDSKVTGCLIRELDRGIAHYRAGTVFWIISSHDQYMANHGTVAAWIKRHFAGEAIGKFFGIRIVHSILVEK